MQAAVGTTALRRRPVFDLKWSLLWQVVAVALLCCLGGVAVVVYEVDEEAWQANRSVGDAIARYLELPLLLLGADPDVQFSRLRFPVRFREADAVFTNVMDPGQCVAYINGDGLTVASSCLGFSNRKWQAPEWFSAFYQRTLGHRMIYERELMHRGIALGKVVVNTDLAIVTARIWSDIIRMLSLSTATVAALCILVYFVVERALRPTNDVLAGLNRLAAGDLKCRLPPFRLAELQRIGDVFNSLATTLEVTTSERAGLARRLVDAREQERRHIARVLHDELAQSLSAMSATAASIKVTAATDCPRLVPEAQTLTETAGNIMKGLRRTLRELRLQEIDDIGLQACLEGLIVDHNCRSQGKTQFLLELDGDVNALPPAMTGHIFHIVQEGLTNAVKHAQATKVRAVVRRCFAQDSAAKSETGTIEVRIEDDGVGTGREESGEVGFGLGLIGIRERTLALGGQMAVLSAQENGLILSVTIPSWKTSETVS